MESKPKLRSIDGGASTSGGKSAPYGLAPEFERGAVVALCRSGGLYAKLGSAIEADCLTHPLSVLALKAAQEYAKEVGKGPSSLLVVLQRLTRWRDNGKLTQQKIEEVSDYFDAAEDAGLPSDEAVLAEMTPILQQRARQSALRMAMEDFARGGDLQKVEQALSKARSIGRSSDVDGSILGGAAFDAIDALRLMDRLPTGISELDLLLDGGHPRGLVVFVGDSGAGKSMALAHAAAEGVFQQLHVGIVSLELPEEVQLARVIANLTGTPINDLLNGRQQRAKDRLGQMMGTLGALTVRYFAPRATKVDDIFRWVEQREQKVGRRMDLLIVDYIDKLGTGSEESTYQAQGNIADALRDYAMGKSMFCLTASQAKRGGGKGVAGKGGGLDLQDVADSMNKVRVADAVITLRKDEDNATMDFFLAKNRLGKSRTGTGPLPQDESCGRIAVVHRRCGW
jgi:KaiC/GvpD/RAD55 family RecA-like ATPase